jgi:hypothetical protein
MLKRFLAWIKSPFTRIVYIEIPTPKPTFDRNAEASIPTLAGHPGFQELMKRLELQRAVLETKLKAERHDNLRSVDFLQLGLFWMDYLKREVDKRVYKNERTRLSHADFDEVAELTKISSLIERIGDNAS